MKAHRSVTVGTPADELRARLGPEVPSGVLALDEAVLASLVSALDRAERDQAAEIARSRDATLKALPWPLRKVIAKVLDA